MIEKIDKETLDTLIANHKNNKDFRIMTDAVFVTKKHLEEFLDTLRTDNLQHNAYKICFIRHETPTSDRRILPAGNNLTQLSLIFVPVKNTNTGRWDSSTEAKNGDKTITTLCFCKPGIEDGKSTGHCPPCDS